MDHFSPAHIVKAHKEDNHLLSWDATVFMTHGLVACLMDVNIYPHSSSLLLSTLRPVWKPWLNPCKPKSPNKRS